jgi:hypothetical protein
MADLTQAARNVVRLIVEEADISDELATAGELLSAAVDKAEAVRADLEAAVTSLEGALEAIKETLLAEDEAEGEAPPEATTLPAEETASPS